MPVTEPVSQLAYPITALFWIVTAIGALVLIGVSAALLYFALRYRARPNVSASEQVFGNRRLELAMIGIPLVIVLILFVLSLNVARAVDPPTQGREPDIRVVGHQWWWEVVYPASGVVTANEIHIPVGRQLLVQVESVDVIHDFWVPNLGRKIDAVPGQPNHVWIAADAPGTYEGACAEFCGAQHAWMRLRVVAASEDEYEAWLARRAQPAPQTLSADAQQGARLFAERTCANCHALSGTAAAPNIGPNLGGIAERQTLGAGVLANSSADLAAWLRDPQQIKPASLMPDLNLDDDEIRQLVAYLEAQP